jgi:hypothetical protein
MTATRRKIHRGTVLAGLALALAACASAPPPLADLDDAESALARATAAGAAASAPVELRFARDKLAGAREANDGRDYRTAGILARQATVDAELAAAKSRAARAREAVRAKSEENEQLRVRLLDGEVAP